MSTRFEIALRDLIKLVNANSDFYRQVFADNSEPALTHKIRSLINLQENIAANLQSCLLAVQRGTENGRNLKVELISWDNHLLLRFHTRSHESYQNIFHGIEKDTLHGLNQVIKLTSNRSITNKLCILRQEIIAHYNAVLTDQQTVAA